MDGVYDEGCVYEIATPFLSGQPFVSISVINERHYDSVNVQKDYSFTHSPIQIVPIGFDVRFQEVIASTNQYQSKKTSQEVYAKYDEIRNREIETTENNIPAIVRISKENFIKYATLSKID